MGIVSPLTSRWELLQGDKALESGVQNYFMIVPSFSFFTYSPAISMMYRKWQYMLPLHGKRGALNLWLDPS